MAKIIWKRIVLIRLMKAVAVLCVIAFLLVVFIPNPDACNCNSQTNKDKTVDLPNETGHYIDPGGLNRGTNKESPDNSVFRTRHKLAVIVPFRDRYTEMLTFVPHIHKYLNAKNIDHKIYVINQVDDLR